MQKWKLVPLQEEKAKLLAQELEIPEIIAHLLVQRGIIESEQAQEFLNPSLKQMLDPETLPFIEKAVARIYQAILAQESIVIYGDYDVDGITGTTILYSVLKALGGKVDYHISDRFQEGYGLSLKRIQKLAEEQIQVLISVDMGCTAVEQAELCQKLGIDLIVTDHHTLPKDKLPEAYALIHPKMQQSQYENKNLCGAGVAYKLAWAVARKKEGTSKLSAPLKELLIEMLGLVSLGTIADVVDLKGENRALVHYGLGFLRKSQLPGIQKLLEIAEAKSQIDTRKVGWNIAPLINASGRISDSRDPFRLLSAETLEKAEVYAKKLAKTNIERKVIQQKVMDIALQQYHECYSENDDSFHGVFLAGENWHEGVVGVIAGQMMNRTFRPVLVASILNQEEAKGSGRSIYGFDLLQALEYCKDLLISYGGHSAALGFKIHPQQIPAFRERFYTIVRQQYEEAPEKIERAQQLDLCIHLDQIDDDLVSCLSRLAPFGQGNQEPHFFCQGAYLLGEPKTMGKDGVHLQFQIEQNRRRFRCVGFYLGRRIGELHRIAQNRKPLHLIFHAKFNEFMGQRFINLYIQDFSDQVENLLYKEEPIVPCQNR